MAYREANGMNAEPELRFQGVVDHVAIKCDDLKQSVTDYQQMGFRLETLYDDWAMMRDVRGFGIALLPPGSHHPQHIGLKVDSLEALRAAAEKEGRPVKEHRDKTISF